jgi:uncharacterized peroxidase-related enzyme
MTMRLAILDRGHTAGTKLLFALIRLASRQPVLDVIKLARYRPDFYGRPMSAVTQQAMRGASAWSVADRELMAAVVSSTNACAFCTCAHSATARRAYGDDAKVSTALSDTEAPNIDEPLRATLRMLRNLTRENTVDPSDMRAVLQAGATEEQVEDALAVCFSFNVICRLADAFGFAMPDEAAFDAGAKYLLARGYR